MIRGSHSPGRKTLTGLLLVLVLTVALLCTGCTSQTPDLSGEGAAPGDLAEIDYTGTLSNGSVFDSSKERGPFQFILGSGTAISGFDDAIQGMKVGETKTFTIPPEEAYGEYNASLIQVFPIDFIPPGENVTIGDTVTLYNGQSFFQAKIAAMNATNVTFDLNSPLAGEALTFSVTLVNLTPAADVAEQMILDNGSKNPSSYDSETSSSTNSIDNLGVDESVKNNAVEYDYESLFRKPDEYKGKYVKQSGKVIQALYDNNGLLLRLATKMTDYGSYLDNIMLISYNGPQKIMENDEITVYGVYQGLNTYDTILGGKNTLPLIDAKDIESASLLTKEQKDNSEAEQYLILNVDSVEDQSTKYSSKTVILGTLKNNHPNKELSSAKIVGFFIGDGGIELDSATKYINDLKPGQVRSFEITSYEDSNKIMEGKAEISSSNFR